MKKRMVDGKMYDVWEGEDYLMLISRITADYHGITAHTDEFERIACELMGIQHSDLYLNTRKRPIVMTRQLCMWYMIRIKKMKYQAVGAYFDKDHATVIHAVKNVENTRYFDDVFDQFKLMTGVKNGDY